MADLLKTSEQLEQDLVQKNFDIGQREKVMHAQNKVLKVRDELIKMLKSKEQRQDEEIRTLQATLNERENLAGRVTKTHSFVLML